MQLWTLRVKGGRMLKVGVLMEKDALQHILWNGEGPDRQKQDADRQKQDAYFCLSGPSPLISKHMDRIPLCPWQLLPTKKKNPLKERNRNSMALPKVRCLILAIWTLSINFKEYGEDPIPSLATLSKKKKKKKNTI